MEQRKLKDGEGINIQMMPKALARAVSRYRNRDLTGDELAKVADFVADRFQIYLDIFAKNGIQLPPILCKHTSSFN